MTPEPIAADVWATNTTLEAISERLRAAKVVTVLTHSRADGDALGSSLAVARALNTIGVRATPVYAGPWSHQFDDLVGDTRILRIGASHQLPPKGEEPDVLLITDTGSWSQLSEAANYLRSRREKTIVIDHHLHGDPEVASERIVDTAAAAAAQPVAELCRLLLGLDAIADLPQPIADPLYLGVATDTGWFRHSNATADAHALAADLLRAGADHKRIYQHVEQRDRVQRLLLMARALTSLEIHADGRAAVMSLTSADLHEVDADLADAGGFSDLPLSVQAVRVAVMMTELEPGVTKLSFRSKPATDDAPLVDVNEIAQSFGGGGHAQAAGARLKAPIEEVRRRVASALVDALR